MPASSALVALGETVLLGVKSLRTLTRRPLEAGQILRQVYHMGNRAMRLLVLMAAFAGMVMAYQFGIGLGRFGALAYIGELSGYGLTREMIPVLSALVLGGRMVAGIAAELGSMVATEQVDAVRALGADPLKKLVMPRLVAATLVLPIFTIVGDLVGLFAAMVVARLEYNVPLYGFYSSLRDSMAVGDFGSGIVKAAIFGLLGSLIACRAGLSARGGTAGVGRATTGAVVQSSLMVVIADFVVTQVDEIMAVAALQSSLFTDEQEAVVHYADVYKRFGSKVVLDGLSLDVRRGEALALLGRSGTGKSVTLKLLIGLLRPDKGKVHVGGADLDGMNERDLTRMRRHIGMVFQGGALFDSMTVAENVAYGLREHFRFSESKIVERVRECLSLVGLEDNVERLEPAALSGGMRKRVAIARAIATWPELLLYDEPTAGLDPATTNQVNSLIVSLKQRLGVTSIIVTHDMPSAFCVADRLALLERGRIVWSGDTVEAREAPPAPLARFLDTDTEEDAWKSLES